MFQKNDQLRFALLAMLSSTVGFALSDRALAQADGDSVAVPQATEQPNDESSEAKSSSESADVSSAPSIEDAQKLRETQRQRAIEQEAENEKLRKSALAGLLILSLICIVFLVLIILVALWARRIRMLTRQPLPEQHPGDPLWYLRKGKGSDSSDIAEFMDSGSSHGES
jgi:cobalamin biosynthesis Mg chelatase CobN